MSSPVRVALAVGLPDAYASEVEDPAATVREAVQALVVRWGVDCSLDPEVRTGTSSLELTVEGNEMAGQLATRLINRVTETADAVALTAGRPDAGWMLRTWVQLMLSVEPALLLSDRVCSDWWSSHRSEADTPMPAWFAILARRVCSLGAPLPEVAEIEDLVEHPDSSDPPDPLHLAETVMAGGLRAVELGASTDTFEALVRSVHAGRDDLEHQLISALGTLGILTPAVTLVRDGTVLPGTCRIRRGGLTVAVCPVPPEGFLLAAVSSELLPAVGVIAPVSLASSDTRWTLVRKHSPAEAEATRLFKCQEADYVVHTVTRALLTFPERLPDRRNAARLLAELYDHVGSGHTVWFTQAALSTEQVVIVLRGMLSSGLPVNELPALLRDLLALIDLRRPSHADFVESFERVLAQRTQEDLARADA